MHDHALRARRRRGRFWVVAAVAAFGLVTPSTALAREAPIDSVAPVDGATHVLAPQYIPACPDGYEAVYLEGAWDCQPVVPDPPFVPHYEGPTFNVPGKKVVTLGDSYSSGTGIWKEDSSYDEQYGGYQSAGLALTGRSDQECWRELQDTPGPRRAAATGATSIFLACKGAEVSHIRNQLTVLQGRWPSSAAAGFSSTELLLTAGGNDLRTNRGEDWPSLLERCIMEINPFGGCHGNSNNQISNFAAIQSSVTSLYTSIVTAAPNAKIRVMGYPRVMSPSKNWLGIWQCPDVTGVTGNEARWMDQQIDALNSRLLTAVNSVKAAKPAVDLKFVSVTSTLTVGACNGQQSFAHINDRVVAWSGSGILLTSDASFHPTRRGYDAYLASFTASL